MKKDKKLKSEPDLSVDTDITLTAKADPYIGTLTTTTTTGSWVSGTPLSGSTTIPTPGFHSGSSIYTYPDPTMETFIDPSPKKELLLIKVTIPERFTDQEISEQIQTLAAMEDQLNKDGFTVKHYIVTSSDCNTPDIEILYPKYKDDEPTKKEKIRSAIKVIVKEYK